MQRREELKMNLENIQKRIDEACLRYGRNRSEITLIAVTKNFPASDIEILAELGIKDVGENKDQEAKEKFGQLSVPLNWHFIGQLQTNKVKSVVKYADFIHSVDRLRLAQEISKSALAVNRRIKILLQLNLVPADSHRGGIAPDELLTLARAASDLENIDLAGLMAVAPLGRSAKEAFAQVAQVQAEFLNHYPEARLLSIGMSDDFEVGIEFGATHLRIGSIVLGVRPILR